MFRPDNSAYAFFAYGGHTNRHISREISIEHLSVGLALLAQLLLKVDEPSMLKK